MMNDRGLERVLVFGDDMRIFLAVVRSLGRAGKEVHAAPFNWQSPALNSKYISTVHRFPRYSEDPDAWRTAVADTLRSNSFKLVVPCCDPAILPLHVHRQDFSDFRIAIPNPSAMSLLFDKARTRQLCAELAIPVVAGSRLDASDTAQQLIDRYSLPLVIKAAQSYSIDRLDSAGKVWIVEDRSDLEKVLATLRDHGSHLVETFFQGAGVGVSVLAEDGKILHAFQHRRLREGRGGASSYRISEPINDELHKACEKICEHTGLTGVCMFEFRYNLNNREWVLLETNARFWGSCALPISLGVDFPRFLYDLLVHNTYHSPVQYAAGIRSRNLVLDGLNLVSSARYLHRNNFRTWFGDLGNFVTQPLRWLTGRERSDSFVSDDVRPALWECATLLKDVTRKLIRDRNSRPLRRHSDMPNAAQRTANR
jgi:predicted ATP-grasp superfamily ATP-dependent carboligase